MSPVRVGFIAPLTGGEAVVAQPMLRAVERGVARATKRFKVDAEVVPVDDDRDPARAAEAVKRLAEDASVVGVVGPKNSGSARAAAPIARAARLPLILPAATADDLCRLAAGSIFRLCATDAATARVAAQLAADLKIIRLAVIADETAYGRSLAASVRAECMRVGVVPVADLKAAAGVFHAMGEVEQAQAIKAARASGFSGVLIGAEGGPGAPLAQLAGAAAEGAYELFAGAAVEDAATVYTAESEDAAWLLIQAALQAEDREGRLQAVRAGTMRGRSGPIVFTPEGERQGATVSVWRIRGGHCLLERREYGTVRAVGV